jgi:hypothetical protein
MASASFSICAYRISVSDIDLDEAIVEMKRPDNISGIRRFLGMVNQLNKFSPKITELTVVQRKTCLVDRAQYFL